MDEPSLLLERGTALLRSAQPQRPLQGQHHVLSINYLKKDNTVLGKILGESSLQARSQRTTHLLVLF